MSSFEKEKKKRIKNFFKNKKLVEKGKSFFLETVKNKYSYNFEWLGMPIIQYPQDIVSLQEIIFKSKPNKIVETGIARGGSLIFLASMMLLLSKEDSEKNKDYKVLSIDIDIRRHTLKKIKNHFLKNYFKTNESSSVSSKAYKFVKDNIKKNDRVMVILDSNHEENHVLEELKLYAPLVSKNCYCIVMDTVIDFLPNNLNADRSWKKNNSPYSAIQKYLKLIKAKKSINLIFDNYFQYKSLLTNMPFGALKRK